MIKILSASSDAYITDRIITGVRKKDSNTGYAGTLDLFKLYGMSMSGTTSLTELSRVLIKFDLDPVKKLISAGKIDVSDPSFRAHLRLFDVYGGQPTPRNFDIVIHPLSRSFDEGEGRDIARYDDIDTCSFNTASLSEGLWVSEGCAQGGALNSNVDYLTFIGSTNLEARQHFLTGEEDLDVDVTTMISATLANVIPEKGLRIALTGSLESDIHTYFVKRFASRHAYDNERHPQLLIRFNDALEDDTLLLELDMTGSVFMFNQPQGRPANITGVTGTNCIILRLTAPVSGGNYDVYFTGSQHSLGSNFVTGTYVVDVAISSTNVNVINWINVTGSVKMTPIWTKLDGSALLTGSAITFYPTNRVTSTQDDAYHVNVTGLTNNIKRGQIARLRVNVAEKNNPRIKLVKRPVDLPGIVIKNSYYSVRDVESGRVIIPFDESFNSTLLSSDSRGMYFDLDSSNLLEGHTYVIDIMTNNNVESRTYKDASPVFKVNSLQ